MFRRLRNALLVLAVLAVVGVGGMIVLATMYETEVKVKLVGALNRQLNAPVTVSDMDLTLLARFPNASMRLMDVLVMEVRSDAVRPDTLLFAKELHLEFSLWTLFGEEQTVKEIHAEQVRLYPALDGNGNGNYLVWRSDSTDAASPLALDRVSFEDLLLRFRDDRKKLEVTSHSEELTLSGRFSEHLNAMTAKGDLHLRNWTSDGSTILEDRLALVQLELEFGSEEALFRIVQGEVITSDVALEVTVLVSEEKEGTVLDLRANAFDQDLADVFKLLPPAFSRKTKRYRMSGEVDLAVHFAGPIDTGPSLSIGATVNKGRFREERTGTTFSEVFTELSLELAPNGVVRKLVIKDLRAKSGSGTVTGHWDSNGLVNATVKAELQANVALAELLRFAQVDTLEQVSGRLNADLRLEGRLRDMADIRPADLRALKLDGTADLRNATLKMKGVRHRVEHMDADLQLNGNDATVQGLKAEIQGSPILLSGTLRDLMPYMLFEDQRLFIEAKGSSSRIDLAALLRSDGTQGPDTREYSLTLPGSIELDLSTSVDELVFEEFKATGITARVVMRDRVLRVLPMSFRTASGSVTGGLELDGRDIRQPYPLSINASLEGIDLQQLFREFQDFGQSFIGHEHLSGTTNARVAFNAPLTRNVRLDMDRLVCVIDISVDKGGIKGHAPLIQIADHLQKNKMVAPFVDVPELRKQLGNVRFDHLENQVEIRNGAVHIPQMLVKSSVMDLELSGTHWFDDRIDHHLNFRLSDLFRKAPGADEFGPVVDDGTGMRVFLHMYGTASDPQFGNDGAMAAARRKQQFQREKDELKSILREDLGLFKGRNGSDETAPKDATPQDMRIRVDWNGSDSTATGPQGSRTRKGKGLSGLLNGGREDPEKERIIIED